MIIFFFKQKTAYEMRISDWSSDVCSPVYDNLHFGRLANDAHCRLYRHIAQDLYETAHADAANLLIMRKREMDRDFHTTLKELRRQREGHRNEALHISGASAVQACILHDHREWICVQVLVTHRAHVSMAGQQTYSPVLWPHDGIEN